MSDLVAELDWSAIAGGGFVASVAMLALIERLRRTFATRRELDGLGEKFNAVESLYLQLREGLDGMRGAVAALEAEQRHQWERTAEQVVRPLERITVRLEALGEAQAAQAAALEHLGRRLEELRQEASTPLNRRRR